VRRGRSEVIIEYVLIAAFIALAGFYSGSETGFYCLNRVRLRFGVEEGRRGAALLLRLSASPQAAISAMVLGTNLGVYLATALCTHNLQQLGAARWADLYSTLLMTPLLLVFAEIIPKSLYQRRANTLMCKTAWPLALTEVAFRPVSSFLRWLSSLPQRIFPSGWASRSGRFTFERFHFLLSEGTQQGILSPYQKAMAENILGLKSRSIIHAMVPLSGVTMICRSAGVEELMELMARHRFSRIPVCSEDGSSIVGIINILDVVCNASKGAAISDLARAPHYLGAEMSVAEALYGLRGARRQMGIVLDGSGNPMGIVTIKDLVEEIVGELRAW